MSKFENKIVYEPSQKISVGLDIGTSKICALVASKDENTEGLKILGIGITESDGLNRGVVVNIEKTVASIKNVIEQAEQQSGLKIEEVVVGIAGDHIESAQQRGLISISNQNNEITRQDLDRLIDDTKRISISADRKILHVIPQDFIIDGQDGIYDPIGISGIRMEANVHIITGMATAIQNVYKCVERAGLKVKDLVLEPIASSLAVLNEDEKEVGVAIVDIGGGTTDIALFFDGVIRYSSVFAIAGKHVTDDIRKVFNILHAQAERIKKEYGHCYSSQITNDEIIMIPGVAGRKPKELLKSDLSKTIQSRMEEIFEFILIELKNSKYYDNLGAGVVITGGASLINGAEELAHQILGLPVKIGIPAGITYTGLAPEIESPVYSTVVGLALWGFEHGETQLIPLNTNLKEEEKVEEIEKDNTSDPKLNESNTKSGSIFKNIKNILKEL